MNEQQRKVYVRCPGSGQGSLDDWEGACEGNCKGCGKYYRFTQYGEIRAHGTYQVVSEAA